MGFRSRLRNPVVVLLRASLVCATLGLSSCQQSDPNGDLQALDRLADMIPAGASEADFLAALENEGFRWEHQTYPAFEGPPMDELKVEELREQGLGARYLALSETPLSSSGLFGENYARVIVYVDSSGEVIDVDTRLVVVK